MRVARGQRHAHRALAVLTSSSVDRWTARSRAPTPDGAGKPDRSWTSSETREGTEWHHWGWPERGYTVLGAGTLLLTAGRISGALTGGSRFDPPVVAGGLALGLLASGAAAWVVSADRLRAGVAWAGIGAGAATFLVAFWIGATTASMDAVFFAGVPTVIALAAAARMAWARRAVAG
jgi:hypothetical protein